MTGLAPIGVNLSQRDPEDKTRETEADFFWYSKRIEKYAYVSGATHAARHVAHCSTTFSCLASPPRAGREARSPVPVAPGLCVASAHDERLCASQRDQGRGRSAAWSAGLRAVRPLLWASGSLGGPHRTGEPCAGRVADARASGTRVLAVAPHPTSRQRRSRRSPAASARHPAGCDAAQRARRHRR